MTDIITRPHYDASERLITFERIQDVEPILELNKALAGERQTAETFHQIGTVPNVILEKWITEDGVNYLALPPDEFARLIKRKLRDPDYAWLRTTSKRF